MVLMIFLVDSNHVRTIPRFQMNLNKNDKVLSITWAAKQCMVVTIV